MVGCLIFVSTSTSKKNVGNEAVAFCFKVGSRIIRSETLIVLFSVHTQTSS